MGFAKSAVWGIGNHATLTLDNVSIHNCREYSVALTGASTYTNAVSQDASLSAATNGSGQIVLRSLTSDHAGLGIVGMNCNGYVTITDAKIEMNTNATYYTNWGSSSNIIYWTTNSISGATATAPASCNPTFYMHGGTIQHTYMATADSASQYPNLLYVAGHNPGSLGVRLDYAGIRYTPSTANSSFLRISNTTATITYPMAGRDYASFKFGIVDFTDWQRHYVSVPDADLTCFASWTNVANGGMVKLGSFAGSPASGAISFFPNVSSERYMHPSFTALYGNTNVTYLNTPNSSSAGSIRFRSQNADLAWLAGDSGNFVTKGSINATNGFWAGSAEGITTTKTIYSHDEAGTGPVTNVITVTKGIITGWTQ
jgi:hypothetical protein